MASARHLKVTLVGKSLPWSIASYDTFLSLKRCSWLGYYATEDSTKWYPLKSIRLLGRFLEWFKEFGQFLKFVSLLQKMVQQAEALNIVFVPLARLMFLTTLRTSWPNSKAIFWTFFHDDTKNPMARSERKVFTLHRKDSQNRTSHEKRLFAGRFVCSPIYSCR